MGMTPCIGYSFGGIIVAIIFPRGNLELNNWSQYDNRVQSSMCRCFFL
jgi:hypothetical protein